MDIQQLYSDLKVKYDNLKHLRLHEAKELAYEVGVLKSEKSELEHKMAKQIEAYNALMEVHRKVKAKAEKYKIQYDLACNVIATSSNIKNEDYKKKYKDLQNRYQSLMSILRANNLEPTSDYYKIHLEY